MKKTSLTLVIAAALGFAGAAIADDAYLSQTTDSTTISSGTYVVPGYSPSYTTVVPYSTVTTTVMGAGPAVVTQPMSIYVSPVAIIHDSTNWGTHPTQIAVDNDPRGVAANNQAGN